MWLLKELMPMSEFAMWTQYLDDEMNEPGRTDYYLAQLTAAVLQPYMPKGRRISLKDFLHPVRFVRAGTQRKMDKRAATIAAKSFLAASFGPFIGKKKDGVQH